MSELTQETLGEFIYDPNKIQETMLDYITTGTTDGGLVVTEPTNPFMMLIEAAAVSGANSVTKPISSFRKLYPDLAMTNDDLRHHLSDSELANMFSVPSEAPLTLYVNFKDLRSNGYRPDNANYVETIMPIGTEIVVAGTTFTLLNNISIKLYDENIVFVEQEVNENDIAVNSLGVLSSGIVTFKDNEPWVVFETIVKQVKKHTINKTILSAEGFDKNVVLNNKYFYSDVSYKNNLSGGSYVKLKKTHSEDFVNPNTPTVYINVMGENVKFKIPDTYLIDNVVSGDAMIEIYETMGKINLPIDKYLMEEFSVNINVKTSSLATASIANIRVLANSRASVEGGRDPMTVDELRDSIINNSTGDIDVPVTVENIKQKGSFQGFEIFKVLDVVTDRVFVASKNLPKFESELLDSKPDIFFNTASIVLTNVSNVSSVTTKDDYLLIKSGTLFKEINHSIYLVDDNELLAINNMGINEKASYLSQYKYFTTPFHYIVDTSDISKTQSRVYSLDIPSLRNIKITGKNTNLIPRVNTDKYGVNKTATGYQVSFSLIGNTDFDSLNKSSLRGQLSIPMFGNTTKLHFHADYNPATGLIVFDINTDLYINSDDYLEINNGTATINNKLISLINTAEFYIYSVDASLTDQTGYLIGEIANEDSPIVFNKESIILELGSKIDHIWNRVYNNYTERMYKKYTADQPLFHTEDVYKINEDGSIFDCVDDGSGEMFPEHTILHNEGDPVLDANGDQVYKYRVGDVILGEDGNPIIDKVAGVVRNIDMLMLEYEYIVANSTIYKNYMDIVKGTINQWLFNTLPELNKNLLENTEIVYKSYKGINPVTIIANNTTSSINYNVSPKITLYTPLTSYTDIEVEAMKNAIGEILHEHLDGTLIKMSDIKDEIIAKLGSDIVGVKIENIDSSRNPEVFSIIDTTKRLVLNKILTVNSNNELIVKYDINLEINTI